MNTEIIELSKRVDLINKAIAGLLLKHGLHEAKKKGFNVLYLSTDLEEFYEKYGWSYITDGFN